MGAEKMEARDDMPRLSASDSSLLREVVSKRKPTALHLVDRIGKTRLKAGEREALRDVLADELCDHGFREDDEPNSLGVRLDDIIGKLMHY